MVWVCRLLMPLISMHRVHVQFQTKLIVEVDDVPRDAILKLLGQVEEDPDITSLEMVGSMTNSQDIQTIVFALVGLLSMRDRTWEAIKFGVTCYYDARIMDESSNSNSSSKCITAMGDESSNTRKQRQSTRTRALKRRRHSGKQAGRIADEGTAGATLQC